MTPKQILDTIKKHNIKVASVEECAKCEWHVCSELRTAETEEEGKCFLCNSPIFFTQKFPEGGPQPKKICIKCVIGLARDEQSFDA